MKQNEAFRVRMDLEAERFWQAGVGLDLVPNWMGDSRESITAAMQWLAQEYPIINGGMPQRRLEVDTQAGRVVLHQHNQEPREVLLVPENSDPQVLLRYLTFLQREMYVINSVERVRICHELGLPLMMPPVKRPPVKTEELIRPTSATLAPEDNFDEAQPITKLLLDPWMVEQVSITREPKKYLDHQNNISSTIINIHALQQRCLVFKMLMGGMPSVREVQVDIDLIKSNWDLDEPPLWPNIILPEDYPQLMTLKQPMALLILPFEAGLRRDEMEEIRVEWEQACVGYFQAIAAYCRGDKLEIRL
jgi:hypothetical protein